MASLMASMQAPDSQAEVERRLAALKADPELEPIMAEIEAGGPAAMKGLRVGAGRSPSRKHSDPPGRRPARAKAARSKMRSPTATPGVGMPSAARAKTPYGRFVTGKGEAGGMGPSQVVRSGGAGMALLFCSLSFCVDDGACFRGS